MRQTRPMLLVLLLACPYGCGKDEPTQPIVIATEQLGSPVTAPGAAMNSATLLWSGRTNELLFINSLGGLAAAHSQSGASRVLDPSFSSVSALSPGDSAVYYDALNGGADSIYARRIALASPAPPRPLTGTDVPGSHLIVPAPDGDQVAIATLGADSLAILRLTTGASTPVTTGIPLAFSLSSAALLVMDRAGDLRDARILTIASGTTQPANLGLPDTTSQFAVRWGATGIEVLYLSDDRQELFYRGGDGTIVSAYLSPDTLRFPIVWSPDGRFAGVWSSRLEGTGSSLVRRHELYSVDLGLLSARRIAFAKGPAGGSAIPLARMRGVAAARLAAASDVTGGLAYSPDGSQLGYVFKARVYRSPNPLPTTRPLGSRRSGRAGK